MISIGRFQGGRQLMLGSGAVGVLGLVLTLVGYVAGDHQRVLYSYLFSFTYWVGIAMAALILLASFHASNARWMVVLRRSLELMSVTCGIFFILFIPVILGAKEIFPWVAPATEEFRREIANKASYLNVPAFIIRGILYFVIMVGVGEVLLSWSSRQDETGDPLLTRKQRFLGAGSIPFLGLAITFASFDWLMSLSPKWYSTIFGAYYFAGSFLSAIAIWTLVTVFARGKDLYGDMVTPDHLHNLGKLLLAFTAFWAYMAFSQYMLIWIGNLPDENFWVLIRTRMGWKPVGIFLALGQFLVPFFILLGQKWKLRHGFLVGMSFWLLFAHLVDIYWLVLPNVDKDGPHPTWTDLTALVGVGGVAVAYGLFRARGGYTLAIRDPFLADSMRYTQP